MLTLDQSLKEHSENAMASTDARDDRQPNRLLSRVSDNAQDRLSLSQKVNQNYSTFVLKKGMQAWLLFSHARTYSMV